MLAGNDKARERILNALYKAKRNKQDIPPLPSHREIYKQEDTLLEVIFAREFQHLGGNFVHCKDETDALRKLLSLLQWKNWQGLYSNDAHILSLMQRHLPDFTLHPNLQTADVSLTTCAMLIARTGSIVMDTHLSDRTSAILAPHHICFAYMGQIVADISSGLAHYHQNHLMPSLISLISGPSKTADIEKTLVKGVHGPEQVFCFLIDEHSNLSEESIGRK